MKKPLDTKKLQELCEAVARNCDGCNNGTIPKAQDEEWAELVNGTLPALRKFLKDSQEQI